MPGGVKPRSRTFHRSSDLPARGHRPFGSASNDISSHHQSDEHDATFVLAVQQARQKHRLRQQLRETKRDLYQERLRQLTAMPTSLDILSDTLPNVVCTLLNVVESKQPSATSLNSSSNSEPGHTSSRVSKASSSSDTSIQLIPKLHEKAQFAYIRLTETPEEARRRRRRQVQEELQMGRRHRSSANRIRGVVERRENSGRLTFGESVFGKLPTEIVVEILSLLSPLDLVAVSEVCESFRVFSADDRIWRRKILALFGQHPPSTIQLFPSQKQLYIAIRNLVPIDTPGCVRWPRHLHGKSSSIYRYCTVEAVEQEAHLIYSIHFDVDQVRGVLREEELVDQQVHDALVYVPIQQKMPCGTRVIARWTRDLRYYPGKIVGNENSEQHYEVAFDDGDRGTIPSKAVMQEARYTTYGKVLPRGTRVTACYTRSSYLHYERYHIRHIFVQGTVTDILPPQRRLSRGDPSSQAEDVNLLYEFRYRVRLADDGGLSSSVDPENFVPVDPLLPEHFPPADKFSAYFLHRRVFCQERSSQLVYRLGRITAISKSQGVWVELSPNQHGTTIWIPHIDSTALLLVKETEHERSSRLGILLQSESDDSPRTQ